MWKHTCKNKKSVTSVFGHGRGKASFEERKTHKKVVNKAAAVVRVRIKSGKQGRVGELDFGGQNKWQELWVEAK